jgi:hypothetical protein
MKGSGEISQGGILARGGGVPMGAKPKKLACSRRVADLVSESIMREAQIFPLTRSRKFFTFAVAAPLDYEWIEKLEFFLDREIREVVYPIKSILQAIDHQYGVARPEEMTCFLWPHWHEMLSDGTLMVKNSAWCGNTHMTGFQEVPPDAPDYEFWRWLTSQKEYARVVNETELPTIRELWKRTTGTGCS